jgi:hypothetical protein
MSTQTDITAMASITAAALQQIGSQLVVDQGRCVDVLLDLSSATDDLGLRWSIAQRLDDIRYLSLVDATEFRADLDAILTIATGPDFAVAASAEVADLALPLAA